jgi:two-component system sporulation sensor kinase B
MSNQGIINSEKLESISHLCSALAHEVRNPMTVAKGFLQLITSIEFEEEKVREYVSIAISEIDQAEKIIRNFLTYARPKTEELQQIRLAEEVKKVILVLEPFANQNSVEISFDCQSYSKICGENTLIQQCLLNICKNAIEAMDSGGTLSITLFEDANNIYVEIQDTGIGMDEEQLKQLGKPFFSTKGDRGTGLGLMASYGILEKFNAGVKVISKKGIGTIFTLSFPLISQSSAGLIVEELNILT